MLSLAITLLLLSTIALVLRQHGRKCATRKESIAIVVLGDIARSPRMMRHALSFADQQWYVSIFAYRGPPSVSTQSIRGSNPPKNLLQHPNIQLVHLTEFPDWISSLLPRILFVLVIGPLKAFYLSTSLIWNLLLKANHSSYILVQKNTQNGFILLFSQYKLNEIKQNPPAIPTLPIVQLARILMGSKLIIDWHNTAYSILALKFGSDRHPMVRVARWIEATFGKHATLHLFVAEAEKRALSEMWSLQGMKLVFYDRPPKSFCRLTASEIHTFFSRSSFNHDPTLQQMFIGSPSALNKEALLTYEDQDMRTVRMKSDRPALLVSSTSWTMDEDFRVLIEALSRYSGVKKKRRDGRLPRVVCLITGKGPLKEEYLGIIARRSREEGWQENGIVCQSVWFDEPEDYRQLLGAADLGISLHQSSSGLDLPMKVVDMFGCGLPVCARNFNCISELVKHGENGLVFDSADELCEQLEVNRMFPFELLTGFPAVPRASRSDRRWTLGALGEGIQTAEYGCGDQTTDDKKDGRCSSDSPRRWSCWEDEWNQILLPSLRHAL
ncbi:hypothetical protein VP01_344g10 [Puccinia sorghi]|uniref:Chitobiosyldiphosphodolichol beta-mannosyltransferase n=1 Tax=Puccinia sorghi TaxID=27349 RepID=A0A0L6UW63_9BASI|nr:hypothetical protein VP01_344g10 [Puccinia sorghi]